MRPDTGRHAPLEPQAALQTDIAIKQPTLFAPRKRKPQRKPFDIQPTDGPADILGRDAFDEIRARAFIQIAHQLGDRAQGQARAGGQIDMPHLRELPQHDGCRLLRGRHNAPCAPLTGMPPGKPHIRQISQRLQQTVIGLALHALIDVDHNRAVMRGPMPRHQRRPVQCRVAQHDKTNCHAQFPFDIRPKISNCRQLIYFSDHLHQRSGSLAMASR